MGLRSERSIIKPRGDCWRDYYIPASHLQTGYGPDLIRKYRSTFTNLHSDTFNDYVNIRNSLWVVSVLDGQWESASCNCPIFLKEYVCKHSIGFAIRKKKIDVPPVAKNIPIGEKHKRGRPRLVTAALLRD